MTGVEMTGGTAPETPWITYHFSVLRLRPSMHQGDAANIGVLLHARTAEFLDARAVRGPDLFARHVPAVDARLLDRYVGSLLAIIRGDPEGGPLALLPPSERFHWITAPRSDLLCCGPTHVGLTRDPEATLERLFNSYVGADS